MSVTSVRVCVCVQSSKGMKWKIGEFVQGAEEVLNDVAEKLIDARCVPLHVRRSSLLRVLCASKFVPSFCFAVYIPVFAVWIVCDGTVERFKDAIGTPL